MIKDCNKDPYGLYYLTKEDIEEAVEIELKEYNPDLLNTPQKLDIEHFIEFKLNIQIEYKSLSNDHSCYGGFVFNSGKLTVYENSKPKEIFIKEKTIILDPDAEKLGESFVNFTLAHEGGHYFTQYNALHINNSMLYHKDIYSKHIESTVGYREMTFGRRRLLTTKEDWMEWQANYCGACLLMNRSSVLKLLFNLFHREFVYNCGFVDYMSSYEYLMAIFAISKTYGVSETAARIRLNELSNAR